MVKITAEVGDVRMSKHPADLVVAASVVGCLPQGSFFIVKADERRRGRGRWRPGSRLSEPSEELFKLCLGCVRHHRELVPEKGIRRGGGGDLRYGWGGEWGCRRRLRYGEVGGTHGETLEIPLLS